MGSGTRGSAGLLPRPWPGTGSRNGSSRSGRCSKPAAPAMSADGAEEVAALLQGGAEVDLPSLRHDARMTSPRSAPTTAARPRSSASRPATSPMIPTPHGPWTSAGRPLRAAPRPSPGPRRSAASSARVARVLAASRPRACSGRLVRVLGQQQPSAASARGRHGRRVDARRERERDGLLVHARRIHPRRAPAGPRARAAASSGAAPARGG